jgi:hypothetical protein
MGVITRGLVTKNIVAPAQGIYALSTGGFALSGSTSIVMSINGSIIAPGDLMIAIIATNSAGAVTWTPPAGWTEVVDQGASPNLHISYKLENGDRGGSPSWNLSTSANGLGAIVAFRGAQWDVAGTTAGATSTGTGSLTMNAVTTTANNSVIVAVLAGSAVSATTNYTTFTNLETQIFNSVGLQIGYKLQPTAGSSGTFSTGFNTATGNNVGVQLSVKPR